MLCIILLHMDMKHFNNLSTDFFQNTGFDSLNLTSYYATVAAVNWSVLVKPHSHLLHSHVTTKIVK